MVRRSRRTDSTSAGGSDEHDQPHCRGIARSSDAGVAWKEQVRVDGRRCSAAEEDLAAQASNERSVPTKINPSALERRYLSEDNLIQFSDCHMGPSDAFDDRRLVGEVRMGFGHPHELIVFVEPRLGCCSMKKRDLPNVLGMESFSKDPEERRKSGSSAHQK
jgi:hypothetical protein